MMKENDLALISAAVYAYLQSIEQRAESIEQIAEDVKPDAPRSTLGVYTERSERAPRSTRKRNSWRWSFAPAIDKKGHRVYQWSR